MINKDDIKKAKEELIYHRDFKTSSQEKIDALQTALQIIEEWEKIVCPKCNTELYDTEKFWLEQELSSLEQELSSKEAELSKLREALEKIAEERPVIFEMLGNQELNALYKRIAELEDIAKYALNRKE